MVGTRVCARRNPGHVCGCVYALVRESHGSSGALVCRREMMGSTTHCVSPQQPQRRACACAHTGVWAEGCNRAAMLVRCMMLLGLVARQGGGELVRRTPHPCAWRPPVAVGPARRRVVVWVLYEPEAAHARACIACAWCGAWRLFKRARVGVRCGEACACMRVVCAMGHLPAAARRHPGCVCFRACFGTRAAGADRAVLAHMLGRTGTAMCKPPQHSVSVASPLCAAPHTPQCVCVRARVCVMPPCVARTRPATPRAPRVR